MGRPATLISKWEDKNDKLGFVVAADDIEAKIVIANFAKPGASIAITRGSRTIQCDKLTRD